VPALVADLPQQLRPTQLSIKIVPIDTDSASGQLPVQLRLDAQGGAPASLQARVQLATTPPYARAIEQARLQLRSASLQLDA
uniref:hypothetical protein n=1 Tax=Pseudomonas sp. 65/3-MNA-CIBAN-0223 TaxID=3140476 RepID=UPI0033249952